MFVLFSAGVYCWRIVTTYAKKEKNIKDPESEEKEKRTTAIWSPHISNAYLRPFLYLFGAFCWSGMVMEVGSCMYF